MTENQKTDIDEILNKLKRLENNILTIKSENVAPFSFYRQSFDTVQEIERLLHDLEFIQIGNMKSEMEKLLVLLSESRHTPPAAAVADTPAAKEQAPGEIVETHPGEKEAPAVQPAGHAFCAGDVAAPNPDGSPGDKKGELPKAPAAADIKLLLSLNDRYLFQRELFHNNRDEMDYFILKLNNLNGFDEAQRYIEGNTAWDFEDDMVKHFVEVVRRRFE